MNRKYLESVNPCPQNRDSSTFRFARIRLFFARIRVLNAVESSGTHR
jgi:hypothetical protein